ncbi:MAG: hypothetical protein ACLGQH_09465 [Acidobacteriota bacterium]
MNNIILLLHAMTGMFFILACTWVYIETLNCTESNLGRIRIACLLAAVLMWSTLCIGGYWYVYFYAPDKALILKGPWPLAHGLFMETKEHVLLMLVPLATFLPIIASNDLPTVASARKLLLWVAGTSVVIGLAMEGAGAIISMGAKLALLPA